MESLQIRTGQLSIQILDDEGNPRGIFRFNPEDVKVAERLLAIQDELNTKNAEMQKRADACETDEEKITLLSEVVTYFRGVTDECFGEGTSDIVFGDANSLTMFYDFFEGIIPYYKKASDNRMAKYKKATKKK